MSTNGTIIEAREMMFGMRDNFKYFECANCGCLQIASYPENMDKYYPSDYYSYDNSYERDTIYNSIKKKLLTVNHLLSNDLLKCFGKKTTLPYLHTVDYIKMLKIKPWNKILDIGCGSARVLRELNSMGFYRLTGVDKFINTEINQFGLKVRALELNELAGKYDVIMMHHVLEHMPEQQSIFISIKTLLSKNGFLIIRLPIKNEAYNLYGSNWVQLDAPRHFYLHTLNSLKFLIEKADLHLQEVIYDSTSFQFWGSEQYKRDISLYRNLQSQLLSQDGLFTFEEMRQWDAQASEFNQKELGDQIMLIIRH